MTHPQAGGAMEQIPLRVILRANSGTWQEYGLVQGKRRFRSCSGSGMDRTGQGDKQLWPAQILSY